MHGQFVLKYQLTHNNEFVHAEQDTDHTLVFQSDSETLTLSQLEAEREFDLDVTLQGVELRQYTADFSGQYDSSRLNGNYTCDTRDHFTARMSFGPVDKRLFCSDQRADRIRATTNGRLISVSLYSPQTDAYEPIQGFSLHRTIFTLFDYVWNAPSTDIAAPLTLDNLAVSLPLNDAVYSQATNRLYASIAGEESPYKHAILEIDPSDGDVTRVLAMGAEVGSLAVSSDGLQLYAGFIAVSEVRKIPLPAFAPTTTFNLGETETGNYREYPLLAGDIEVSPVDSHTFAVIVFEFESSQSGYRHYYGVKVFGPHAPPLYNKSSSTAYPTRIAFNALGDTLYGYQDESTGFQLRQYELHPDDLISSDIVAGFIGGRGDITVQGDTVYSAYGDVVSLKDKTAIGRYNRLFGHDYNEADGVLISPDNELLYRFDRYIEVYDRERFTFQGVFNPQLTGSFLRMVNVGQQQFAVVSTTGLQLYRHNVIPTDHRYDCQPAPSIDNRTSLTLRQFFCPSTALVHDKARQLLYAAIPGAAGSNGNAVAIIDGNTYDVIRYIPVGSGPSDLELSQDGERLYIGFDHRNEYAVLDLNTHTIIERINTGYHFRSGPFFVKDIKEFPSHPDSVAIVLKNQVYLSEFQRLAAFVNGVQSPSYIDENEHHEAALLHKIAFASPNRLIGYDYYHFNDKVIEYSIDQSGVYEINVFDEIANGHNLDAEIHIQDGILYNSAGDRINLATMENIGTYADLHADAITSHRFAIDPRQSVIFYYATLLSGQLDPVLKAYDLHSRETLATHKMPIFSLFYDNPVAVIDMNATELLMATDNWIYIADKDEILESEGY